MRSFFDTVQALSVRREPASLPPRRHPQARAGRSGGPSQDGELGRAGRRCSWAGVPRGEALPENDGAARAGAERPREEGAGLLILDSAENGQDEIFFRPTPRPEGSSGNHADERMQQR